MRLLLILLQVIKVNSLKLLEDMGDKSSVFTS